MVVNSFPIMGDLKHFSTLESIIFKLKYMVLGVILNSLNIIECELANDKEGKID